MQPWPDAHTGPSGHCEASGHDIMPVHETSHEQAFVHAVCLWHDASPLHVTLHAAVPHWMTSPHAFVPMQSTSHALAGGQIT